MKGERYMDEKEVQHILIEILYAAVNELGPVKNFV